jgi:signal transduction histidine kinase
MSTSTLEAKSSANEMCRSRSNEQRPRTERILLVDDSPVTRRFFSLYLSHRYDCIEAGSYEEAISLLKKFKFSVVVTDIIMPGISGIELLRKVVSDFKPAEVIILSGVDRPQRALDAIRLGAFDYLIKPCEPNVLEVTIQRAVERRNIVIDANRYKLELETQNAELVARKTEMERLQAQVIQSEKMASLGQLAAGIAHELNNPVGFVHANLEMLDDLIGDLLRLVEHYELIETTIEAELIKTKIGYPQIKEDITEIIRDCREGSDRVREIVQNLRTFSRLDEAEYKEVDLHDGIDATVRMLSRYFSAGNIELRRNYGDLPHIGAHAGPLNQVWMNLLANAAQAIGPRSGVVTIDTREDDENVFVEISDTGSGIAVQHMNRIFDPFFTTKPVGEGTGLGLSISFSIVERHGGMITVESRLNEGTAFRVQLPKRFQPAVESDEKSIACYVKV